MKIKRGDKVMVIAGDDKNTIGEVIKVDRKNDRVLVQGVNMITKHHKPSQNNPEGYIEETEGFIHVSNVAYYDSSTKKVSKIRYEGTGRDKVRVAKKTNTYVDKKKAKSKK